MKRLMLAALAGWLVLTAAGADAQEPEPLIEVRQDCVRWFPRVRLGAPSASGTEEFRRVRGHAYVHAKHVALIAEWSERWTLVQLVSGRSLLVGEAMEVLVWWATECGVD